MSAEKEFKEINGGAKLKVGSFDQDKEIEFSISEYGYDYNYSVYLSPNQINELVSHLLQCLKDIKE